MVSLTFVIGCLNLCLGYALAVNLGYGPPSLRDAWRALLEWPPCDGVSYGQTAHEPSILSVWKSLVAVEQSRTADLSGRLRKDKGQTDRGRIRECVAELKALCEATLKEQGQAAERLEEHLGGTHELGTAGEGIEQAVFEQLAQLETTVSNVRRMDLDDDLATLEGRLTEEIDRMLSASRSLGDVLERAKRSVRSG